MKRAKKEDRYASVRIKSTTHGLRRLLPCEVGDWSSRMERIIATGSEHGKRRCPPFSMTPEGGNVPTDQERLRVLLRVGH